MTGKLNVDQLTALVRDGSIDTVIVAMPDLYGRLVGKRVTGSFFLDSVIEETHACNYLLTADMDMELVPGYKSASWEKGYGDFALKPDLNTLRLIPWLPATALVICDTLDHDGEEVAVAPRAILKKQLKRLAALGMSAHMASELEFYLFDDTFETAHEKRYRDLKTASWYIEDYHIFQTSKEEGIMRAIRNGLEGANIPVENSKGEWGPGQEEINVRYCEALEMADRHVILKNGIKEIAHLHGKSVTFMAKWNNDLAGNSSHAHCSFWNEDVTEAKFSDSSDPEGMSPLFRHFLAGQLASVKEMTYFLAPVINSYKRFADQSFAPTTAIWSKDNRSAGYRVVGHGKGLRAECRIGGADVNPYLSFAAIIAAGLHGIDNKLELEPEFRGDAYARDDIRFLPKTLREALDLLDKSEIMRTALGDDVVDHYVHTGRWEQSEYDRRVTDWELLRGFERG
jgi:glutamine synthetase